MAHVIPGIEDKARLGIALMLVTWAIFSLLDTGAKWLAVASVPVAQIALFRYLGHFVISTALVLGDAEKRRLPPRFWLVSLRGIMIALTTLLNFWTLQVLPLTVTSAIMFSSPVIVCFLTATVLREYVGPWRWSAILLGFMGVLVVIQPFGETFHPLMLVTLFNAVAVALYSLITRSLAGQVSTDVMQFWMGFWGFALMIGPALWVWQTPEFLTQWLVLIVLGVLGWGGHQCLTIAHRFATANTLMPFTYSFLLYLTILGYLVFDHIPTFTTLLGAGIIMISGLVIWYREGQRT